MFHQRVAQHRLFFALQPPPVLARQLANAAPWVVADDAVRADRLHVTLFILGDMATLTSDVAGAAGWMGDQLQAAAIDMVLDRVVGSRSSVALRPDKAIAPLSALRRRLVELAGTAGIAERADYSFSPHMTLGYRRGEPFQERITPLGWRAGEMVLIHSLLGRTRHEVLGRWALTGVEEPQLALL